MSSNYRTMRSNKSFHSMIVPIHPICVWYMKNPTAWRRLLIGCFGLCIAVIRMINSCHFDQT